MCGIAGWVGSISSKDDAERLIRAMCDTLAHRGPDDDGYYVADNIALGHRRLSIIDLRGGHQPMFGDDGEIGIIFNGEIYNFPELRAELEKKGYKFATRSDTEVLLKLYEDEGEEMLSRLNGMFSFAIWDGRKKRLFAARDRMGKKPFYYAVKNGAFIFASEPKALLCHPKISRDMDLTALSKYLAYEYIPAPYSIFRDIRKLPGAHALTFSADGTFRVWKYWSAPFADTETKISESEAAETILNILKDSVSKRLISDVPLGVFLSGGIDSSAVVAMMAELVPPKNIKTFSIAFKERSFDESHYADKVAKHFGTDHREEVLSPSRMLEIIPDIADKMDEPFADPSIVPTYLLSGFTRKYVTVALGGDGGDELFAGYPTFVAHKAANIYEKIIPLPLHKIISAIADRIPVSHRNISVDFRIKRFLAGIPYPEAVRHFIWTGAFSPEMQSELFKNLNTETDLSLKSIYGEAEAYLSEAPKQDSLHRAMYLYYKLYLQDDILTKVDRASMMHSLEVRAPFLDVRMVEYASRLPSNLKLKGITAKYILKKALRKKLPYEIISRPKKGFGIPVAKWFKEDLRDYIKEIFSEERVRRAGFFSYPYVSRLLNEHLSGRYDRRKPLWALFMFELWRERWIK